jgi:nucleoside-diphosphate-sugar epimerase
MVKTIITGRDSNLSRFLESGIENTVLVSSREILRKKKFLPDLQDEPVNIIINSFQPATMLNDLSFPADYIQNCITSTALILEKVKSLKVNKLIYTSSASVYGDNILCRETDATVPQNLHAALKLANEKLVEKICRDHEIDYTITRNFNMYGGEDNFSVISKILNCCKNDELLMINNNGNAIRDFIHIADIVAVYQVLLQKKGLNLINAGTGKGVSVKSILELIRSEGCKIRTENFNRPEINISTACTENLARIIDVSKFTDIRDYIREQIRT